MYQKKLFEWKNSEVKKTENTNTFTLVEKNKDTKKGIYSFPAIPFFNVSLKIHTFIRTHLCCFPIVSGLKQRNSMCLFVTTKVKCNVAFYCC